jgi:small subunit ribosomal protein S1
VTDVLKTENTNEEQFDMNLAEDRFQYLSKGQIVEATVILVKDGEVFVDIGGKSDLVIPLEELTSKPVSSAKEVVQVGDKIKAMVVKIGDDDGILLSRKRIEQEEVWDLLETVYQNQTPVDAYVDEVVKGGLSVRINGLKGFMPASQSSLGFVKDLADFVGQTYQVKIIEFDRSKRRIVVSRRVILEVEKLAAESSFYQNITEGQRQTGKVTRITDFGAFVDLGSGIEGLIHISELSWYRVKSVKDVLKEGDQVEVLITKIDQANKKISLSLKQVQNHPWDEKIKNFEEGKVYQGVVVKLESFGAFIRLTDGIEGLAHVSQISEKRISKPDEVLTVGAEVQAKIIKIDYENRKVALSLKQVTEDKVDSEISQFLDQQEDKPITQSIGDLINK